MFLNDDCMKVCGNSYLLIISNLRFNCPIRFLILLFVKVFKSSFERKLHKRKSVKFLPYEFQPFTIYRGEEI